MGLNGREVFVLKGYDEVAVFLGLDVGKEGHHAVAQDRSGKKLLDRALPNDEAKLRELYGRMKAHGPVLLVVDQPAPILSLPVAVALDEGVTVAYLPGLAMRRIVDLHPGSAKTDARDAAVIANAARTMPHTLRALQLDDETIAELTVMSGFDDDLAGQITATSNRIRGLLTRIHPALERVLGPRLDHPAVLDLLESWPTSRGSVSIEPISCSPIYTTIDCRYVEVVQPTETICLWVDEEGLLNRSDPNLLATLLGSFGQIRRG